MVPRKIVVLTGAGMSAPSGLATFRDSGGLWRNHRIEDVATFEAWRRQPEIVLEFYNQLRVQACAASPNDGHLAIASLEKRFEVIVITQNVDDLHERAGSTKVIHLHGELTKARSTVDPELIYHIGASPIRIGDRCERGSQLRPHIVWFNESVPLIDEALRHVREAERVLVVGTSLSVYPAAGLIDFADELCERVLVDTKPDGDHPGFRVLAGSAEIVLPQIAGDWLGK
jgi:NAD-dependent deacetylase